MNSAEMQNYTYADYLTWGDDVRYELIDGYAYVMESPSQRHQELLLEIAARFRDFLKGKPCKVFIAPFDVRLNADSLDDIVVQPDLLIVCDKSKLDGKSVTGAPDMVMEILSTSNSRNKRHDTFVKFKLYQKAGVREYWIVDPDENTVSVYILENGKYFAALYDETDIVSVHVLENCEINLKDVFEAVGEI